MFIAAGMNTSLMPSPIDPRWSLPIVRMHNFLPDQQMLLHPLMQADS
jgi:hypothetical protein